MTETAPGPRLDPNVTAVPPARAGLGVRALTLTAACAALFVIFLDNTIVNVAVPTIQHSLGAGADQLEWIVNAYVVVFAGFVLLMGRLGDRWGRRRLFASGLVLFAAASAAGALAGSPAELIAARAVQGLGAALLAPLSLSLLAHVFAAEELPTVIGVWAGVSGLGLAIGPLAGGLLIQHSSWHAVFWVNVPIAALAALLTLIGVPESRQAAADPVDVPGAALVTAGLVAGVAGLARAVQHPWTDRWTLSLLVAGGLLLLLFVASQLRARSPLVPVSWLRDRGVVVSVAALALASFALFGAVFLVSIYLQDVRGYSAVQAGVRLLPMTLATLLVAPPAGRIAARRGPLPVLIAGLTLTGLATATLTQVGVSDSYGWLAARLATLGVGLALALPPAVAVLVNRVGPDQVGVASGVATMGRQFGGALGLALLATAGGRAAADHFTAHGGPKALAGLVSGADIGTVRRLAGPHAADLARQGFVTGFGVAMWLATAAVAASLLIAIAGYAGRRRVPPTAAVQPSALPDGDSPRRSPS